MIEILQLFILGIGVGCFGALVGIGGGLIMVPLFVLAMMPPPTEPHFPMSSKSSVPACSVFSKCYSAELMRT